MLRAERDENICRKEMTVSEKVALGRQIEELERPAAAERQGTRTDLSTFSPRGLKVEKRPQSTEIAAQAVDMSRPTYQRAMAEGFERASGRGTSGRSGGDPLRFT